VQAERAAQILAEERIALVRVFLNALPARDRDVLIRFYVDAQPSAEICKVLGLTESEFRLIKSRAKARFARLALMPSEQTGLRRARAPKRSRKAATILFIDRILPVVSHAVAVFGDERKATHWMKTPLPLLQDRAPSQVLEEEDGLKIVDQILTRIEHNIPS
jgi:putative toxin-antitoxin system antitoxin component (TIGR02293 family)